MNVDKRCRAIELVASDVDGVLTDGRLVFGNDGVEFKRFHVRDGLGIKLWRQSGGTFALITARSSHAVSLRASELGIEHVRQGAENKLAALRELLAELRLAPEQACYIGDDLPDLAAARFAGLGVAVADGCAELREAADYVCTLPGGQGAVRETIEWILKSQSRWDELILSYRGF
jgi:YrbI family 3-deoxy-D-manno-octulosonate 8-phosphate phosphatase